MHHLVKVNKNYKEKGLVIIGEESYLSPKESVEAMAKKIGVTFSITQGTSKPSNMEYEPHAAVFSTSGKLVFSGYPDEALDRAILKELKIEGETGEAHQETAPAEMKAIIESRTWTNTDGKEITAAVIQFVGDDQVRFKLPDGRETNFPIAKLTEADQKLIDEARKAAVK